jgi:hypothetical protein
MTRFYVWYLLRNYPHVQCAGFNSRHVRYRYVAAHRMNWSAYDYKAPERVKAKLAEREKNWPF